MTERPDDRPVTFCWFDLLAPRPQDAAEFYQALFGWLVERDDETGQFTLATTETDGDVGTRFGGIVDMGSDYPAPHWVAYLGVPDVDVSYAAAVEASAEPFVEPRAAGAGIGRFAMLADPAGALFALFDGEDVLRPEDLRDPAPGQPVGARLYTAEPAASASFYARLLGLLTEPLDADNIALTCADRPVAEVRTPRLPDVEGWTVAFHSGCDPALARARAVDLGAEPLLETDPPLLADPGGAIFEVV